MARVRFEYPPPIREPLFVIAHTLAMFLGKGHDIIHITFTQHGPNLTRLFHNHPHHVRGAPRAVARLCGGRPWRSDAATAGQADAEPIKAHRPGWLCHCADRHVALWLYLWLGQAGRMESVQYQESPHGRAPHRCRRSGLQYPHRRRLWPSNPFRADCRRLSSRSLPMSSSSTSFSPSLTSCHCPLGRLAYPVLSYAAVNVECTHGDRTLSPYFSSSSRSLSSGRSSAR